MVGRGVGLAMDNILLIYKKELRDMFRDRRVRSTALITPVVMMWVFMYLFGFLGETVTKPNNVKIHVVKPSPFIEQFLQSKKFAPLEVNSVEEGENLIKKGDSRLVIQFPPGLTSFDNITSQQVVRVFYDPKQELSQLTLGQLEGVFAEQNKQLLEKQLEAHGLPSSQSELVKLDSVAVQVGGKAETSQLLIGLLPYLVILWAFLGGVSIATELVAGEKEKNTLETLLISPVTRGQIALGKWLSLSTVCLLSSVMTFVGLFIFAGLNMPGTKTLFPHGVGISPGTGLLVLAILIPMVAFFASLLLAVSTYAKNTREAQGYLAGINFIVILPAMMSQFIGYTEFANSQYLYLVPVLNTATIIRQVLQAKIDWGGVGITVGISLVLALLAMRLSIKLFTREQVLTRV